MTLKEMEYVITIAKYESFSKAADVLFVSQSALSQAITKLEKELGLQLFRRNNKNVSLTFAGEMFFKKGEEILNLTSRFSNELNTLASCKKRIIRLGIHQSYGKYFLPKLIPFYKKLLPNVQIKMIEDYSANLEKLLLEDKLDVIISTFQEKNSKLSYKKFFEENILLAIAKNNHLNRDFDEDENIKEIDLTNFKDENFILLIKEFKSRKIIDNICKSLNFTPNCILESKDFDTINSLVAQNMGVGFVPSSINKDRNSNYYKIKNVDSNRNFYIVYKKNIVHRPYIIAEFIKLAENAMINY
ncbi:MAG: LysR family transcriptional regulator [Fusobacterium sp. JB021]|nr:LysR family transcriptional regulator [Fusobacterium sp. JB020]MDP0494332.1 LysR family transcriptional regulator [Fusobacterium sp. JB021]MDP0506299.1 LysR family transcriptional regulator [Fusobacterium sp. JB019]